MRRRKKLQRKKRVENPCRNWENVKIFHPFFLFSRDFERNFSRQGFCQKMALTVNCEHCDVMLLDVWVTCGPIIHSQELLCSVLKIAEIYGAHNPWALGHCAERVLAVISWDCDSFTYAGQDSTFWSLGTWSTGSCLNRFLLVLNLT